MAVGEICNRDVVFVRREDTVLEAAKLMRQHHVGNLVVVDEKSGRRTPVGILTDRDIVLEIMAKEVPLESVTVGDVMSPDPITVTEDRGVWDTIKLMRAKGVRRLPVVNRDGGLEGILTVDDLLGLLTEELADLARLVTHEQAREKQKRR